MKTCSKCKETKSLDEFSMDKSRKDDRQPVCKLCNNKYWKENREWLLKKHAEYNKRNREKTNRRKNAWYQDNKDEINRKERERYHANRDEIRKKKNAWYQKNKERVLKRNRERIAEHGEKNND